MKRTVPKPRSVKRQISVTVLLICILSSSAIGVFSLLSYAGDFKRMLAQQAMEIAQTVSLQIDGEQIVAYDQTEQTDAAYDALLTYLSQVKSAVGMKYLYIMTDAGENYKYIAEGTLRGEEASALGDTQTKQDYGPEPEQVLSQGIGAYTLDFVDDATYGPLLSGFAPIVNGSGGVVGVVGVDIAASAYQQEVLSHIPFFAAIILIACVLANLLIYSAMNRLFLRPLAELEQTAQTMASGHFDITLSEQYLNANNEIGQLTRSFATVSSHMQHIIQDTANTLREMEHRNLTAQIQGEYPGDCRIVQQSINNIIATYHDMLHGFRSIGMQVDGGAKQMAAISATLAQGATEQSSSVDLFSTLVSSISETAHENLSQMDDATQNISAVTADIEQCNTDMQETLSAMREIESTSAEISGIMKFVDTIAFQTNILALNAAVEAARAGESGKGFAVVADEVRQLASKSAQAAQQTAVLIENALRAVEKGKNYTGITSQAMQSVSEKVYSFRSTVEQIKNDSMQQAASIAEIQNSMQMIADVTQSNAATAEESAATSQTLSAQAAKMEQEIQQFQL